MNRKYLNIPEKFQGKIIFITGSLPGVGKSFIKNLWADKLEKAGFRVFNKGSTWKASTNGTMASQSLKYVDKKFISNGSHPKTNGFYFIDEAFMISQEKMDVVIKAYPYCCFILIGDPLQFDPADGGTCLYRADLIIDLTKQMRAEDELLLHTIQNIKDGVLPINFMLEHSYDSTEIAPKLEKSLVISYKKCFYEKYKSHLLLKTGEIVRSQSWGTYTDQYDIEHSVSNNAYRNGDLWKIESTSNRGTTIICSLRRLSDDFKINVSEDDMHIFFDNARFINAHKCQGDTIKNQDIYVNIDPFLENSASSLQKYLYVAISRAQYSKQIIFNKDQVLAIKDVIFNKMDYEFNKSIPMVSSCSESLAIMTVEQILDTLDYIGIPYLRAKIEIIKDLDDSDKNVRFRPLLYIYLNLDKNVRSKKDSDSSFGLDLSQNKLVTRQNGLTEMQFKDANEKRAFVNNLDKDLNNRPLQSIPDKGKCFISKNKMLLNAAKHDDNSLEELHWFVFESDEMTLDEQYALLDRRNKKNINKYLYRVIYSGNKSLHYWIYIKNAPKDIETYKKTAKALNKMLFDGKACQSCISPSGLMRAPNVVRPDTNKEQEIIKRTRKVCCFDYSIFDNVVQENDDKPIENVEPTKYDNKVQYAFNLMKNDHDRSNGGRGRLILAKAHNEIDRGWTKEEACQLIEMLCLEWGCPEKIERLKKNIY